MFRVWGFNPLSLQPEVRFLLLCSWLRLIRRACFEAQGGSCVSSNPGVKDALEFREPQTVVRVRKPRLKSAKASSTSAAGYYNIFGPSNSKDCGHAKNGGKCLSIEGSLI